MLFVWKSLLLCIWRVTLLDKPFMVGNFYLSPLQICHSTVPLAWRVSAEKLVIQSCSTLWDPIECSPPGSSVQGILREQVAIPVFLSGVSHGRRSLVGYSPRVTKIRTRLSNFTFTFPHTEPKPWQTSFLWGLPVPFEGCFCLSTL